MILASDPSIADLFIIPLVPSRPTYDATSTYAPDFKGEVAGMCNHLFHDEIGLSYAHLTQATARSHLVAAVDYTPILAFCAMSGNYATRPRSHRLLQRMPWIIHEDFENADRAPHRHYSFAPGLPGTNGGMAINMPFPSGAVHERSALTRLASLPRPFLVSFTGSLNGSPENRQLRVAISRQCRKHGEPTCRMNRIAQGLALDSDGASALMDMKRQSVFCAEPGGHNRIRKGVIDAALCGCIPVLFLRADEMRRLWPLHWFGWRNETTVTLRAEDVTSGELDVVAWLRQVPRERIAAMQRTLAENAQRLAYLVDRDYEGDDAMDVLLKGLAFGLPGRR